MISLAFAVLTTPVSADTTATGPDPAPTGRDWGAPGPYTPQVEPDVTHTFYYPADLARSDRRHPVIIWGNGTFAIPAVYSGLLRHLASHGFIVVAANTPNPNFGIFMLNGLDRLEKLNRDPDGPFHGRVDMERVGAAGHFQGGAAAINAGRDPRVDTSVALQPGPLATARLMRGPLLILAGEEDRVVPPIGKPGSWLPRLFREAGHVPAVYAERAGAKHLEPLGNGGGFRAAATAWFRLFLMGDGRGTVEFFGDDCGICVDEAWSRVTLNRKAQAHRAAA